MPKISVIMPAYNAEKYIAEAIDSILGQTFGDFEFIILNDCSTDRTEEIILSYDDPRIVYLKNEQNMGVAATLNKGLAIAKGEYIAFLDADDYWAPEKLKKQIAFMQENGYSFSYTNYIEISEDSVPNGKRVSGPKRITKFGESMAILLEKDPSLKELKKSGLHNMMESMKSGSYKYNGKWEIIGSTKVDLSNYYNKQKHSF